MVFPQQIYVANKQGFFLGHVTQKISKINKSCVFGFINRHDIAKVYKYLYDHGMQYQSQKMKSGNFCIIPQTNKIIKQEELKIDCVDSQNIINLLSINNVNLAFIHKVDIDTKNGTESLVLSTSAEIYNLCDTELVVDFLNHMINIDT
jgi:hypothetical protein